MKKVNQTKLDTEKQNGDCVQACIASLFDKNLEEIPKFQDSSFFFEMLATYCRSKKFNILETENENIALTSDLDGYYLAIVETKLGNYHCVIMKEHQLIHDPSPFKSLYDKKRVVLYWYFKGF